MSIDDEIERDVQALRQAWRRESAELSGTHSGRPAATRRRFLPVATFASLSAGLLALAGLAAIVLLFRTDAGESAAPMPLSTLMAPDYHALAISPRDPSLVFFGYHQGIRQSTDGGISWRDLPIQGDAMSLAIHPVAPQVIYAAGHYLYFRRYLRAVWTGRCSRAATEAAPGPSPMAAATGRWPARW